MDEFDLLAEAGGAVADLWARERDDTTFAAWLNRRGWTKERRGFAGGLGMAAARLDRQRDLWEPAYGGESVFVLPCWDGPACEFANPFRHDAPLVDLVAWRPAEPNRLFRRTGAAWVVGIEGISCALESNEPLRLCRNLERFVCHGGERSPEGFAAVLVDSGAAWWALEGMSAIVCDDLDHAEEIDALIAQQRPAAPAIRLPRAALEVAA